MFMDFLNRIKDISWFLISIRNSSTMTNLQLATVLAKNLSSNKNDLSLLIHYFCYIEDLSVSSINDSDFALLQSIILVKKSKPEILTRHQSLLNYLNFKDYNKRIFSLFVVNMISKDSYEKIFDRIQKQDFFQKYLTELNAIISILATPILPSQPSDKHIIVHHYYNPEYSGEMLKTLFFKFMQSEFKNFLYRGDLEDEFLLQDFIGYCKNHIECVLQKYSVETPVPCSAGIHQLYQKPVGLTTTAVTTKISHSSLVESSSTDEIDVMKI